LRVSVELVCQVLSVRGDLVVELGEFGLEVNDQPCGVIHRCFSCVKMEMEWSGLGETKGTKFDSYAHGARKDLILT